MSDEYDAIYYSKKQFASSPEAVMGLGLKYWEVTYGYSATKDAFINVCNALEAFGTPNILDDLVFEWKIDGVFYGPCGVEESHELLDRSYDYFAEEKKTSKDLVSSTD